MTETVAIPEAIRLFPIRGCIMLPGEALPLNVFEPRYLNMIDDAMAAEKVIGIIQPAPGGAPDKPALRPVGTAGRIASFKETEDGRYLIVLQGLIRFRLAEELDMRTPYRMARADYLPFKADVEPAPLAEEAERAPFLVLLKRFFETAGIEADWDSLSQAPLSAIADKVALAAPFDPDAKQALLEASDPPARVRALSGMMSAAVEQGGQA